MNCENCGKQLRPASKATLCIDCARDEAEQTAPPQISGTVQVPGGKNSVSGQVDLAQPRINDDRPSWRDALPDRGIFATIVGLALASALMRTGEPNVVNPNGTRPRKEQIESAVNSAILAQGGHNTDIAVALYQVRWFIGAKRSLALDDVSADAPLRSGALSLSLQEVSELVERLEWRFNISMDRWNVGRARTVRDLARCVTTAKKTLKFPLSKGG